MRFEYSSKAGFRLKSFSVGPLQCNCSLVWDETSKEAILIDPGDEGSKIKSEIETLGLKVTSIIHTHAHFDHIGASADLSAATKAPLLLHSGDEFLWKNLPMQGQVFGFSFQPLGPWNQNLEDEMTLNLGSHQLKTLWTPGHTPGSCCFSIGEILFSGDTLFDGSIGRTDLWGGDFGQIQKSIRERVFSLDGDTTVICGHGPNTNIGKEKTTNPFV
jgi:glyoxylase-like metal-dependent hydrolase (beta-lactamase superfamily II)